MWPALPEAPAFRHVKRAALGVALLALSFFALRPLLNSFMFASADGLFHLYRLVEFDRVLRAGVPYPRWAPDLMAGYGYPLFTFYAPLEFYLGSAFHLVGLSFVTSTKAVVALGMVASLAGMYALGREWWGRLGGFIAAVSYLYAPYRLVNTYLDGELSQTLAWAWLPWLFWACWRGLHAQTRAARWRYALLATLCSAGLLYTHSVMSWLAALLLGLWLAGLLALRLARVDRVARLGTALVLGVGLAAPYWLPALAEQGLVQLQRARAGTWDFHVNFLPLARTLSTQLTHQYQGYAGVNGPAQVGLAQALVALFGLLALVGLALASGRSARRAAGSGQDDAGGAPPNVPGRLRLGLLLAALGAAFFLLMLAPAVVFWDHFPFGSFLQFPDRLLAPIAFCLAALSGGSAPLLERWSWPGQALAGAMCGLLIYGGAANLQVSSIALPAHLGPREVVEYEQQTGTSGSALSEFAPRSIGTPPVGSALVPRYLDGELPSRAPAGAVASGRPVLGASFRVHSLSAGPATIPLAFFPGWSAAVNGRAAPLHATPQGLDELQLPGGTAQVRIFPSATPDRLAATAVGLASALALLALALLERRWRGARFADEAGIIPTGTSTRASAAIAGAPSPPWMVHTATSAGRRPDFEWGSLSTMLSKPPAGLVVPGLLAVACALAAVISVLHSPPAAAPSPASQPLDVAYDNGVILLGSDVQVTGAQLHAMVYFREPATPVALAGTVRLTTLGQPWASAAFHVPAATAGALPRVPVAMPLPPGTPAGSYGLELTLRNAAGDEVHYSAPRLTYKLPFIAAVDLGPVTIPRIVPGSPGGQPPATGAFGPLTLERWSPPADARQGALVPVNLWWRPSSPLPANLVCSLHVVDAAGTLWAVRDAPPREGHNPTQAWAPGVTVRNQQEILLPPQIPPGTYTLRAGWYDQNGQQPFGPRNVAIGSFHVGPAQAPSAASVTIPIRFAHAFPDGLDLLGYQLTSRQVTSGTDLPLSLFWRVGHRPAAQPVLTLSLGSETLRVPLPAPTDLPAGTTFETRSALPTSGVSATLTIGLGLAPAVAGSGEQITLPSATELRLPESVMVAAPVRLTTLPPGATVPANNILAGAAELAGYTSAIDHSHGQASLSLTLYWKALRPLPADLHVFVHILNRQGEVIAQHDGVPDTGRRATQSWLPVEYVRDAHDIALPTTLPAAGPLALEVGLYNPASGQRLGTRVLLTVAASR